ncbi:SDR family oxidoreductase [Chitinophaga sp. S165]|uniref:SDR family oxidoreductase n=1 Tax=Chitinophaga sp. S165 TaxID=2135462 RepID=UPI000D70C2E8|nr:SDR family oxidoreductase [Chitinophaga sp. S165]PWV56925.1 NADP-dependent 3-hydroxy acid dehydrogenase YdfG [Chitinophaga sp. S165]
MTTNITHQAYTDYLSQNISGKSILVTGGTTGIGRAISLLLASMGANILLTGLDQAHLEDTLKDAGKIDVGDKIRGIIADMSTSEGIENIFNEVDKRFKGLDILINNAALAYQSIVDGNYKEWEYIIKTNLLGYLACSNRAIEKMKARQAGHIINIGSMSADVREKGSSVYVATKSGIQGFSESLRKEVNEYGIKVTLIEPGAVGTDMQPSSPEEQREKIKNLEMLKAEDIAYAVVYCLAQPSRCDVVELKIRPHLQMI